MVQGLWNFIVGRGSQGPPAVCAALWWLTISRSNSQPAVTVLPSSLMSSRTVAASGTIQPSVMASRKGTQRLTVSALFVALSPSLSSPGSFLNQAGWTVLAGTGSAITPLSPGSQRNSMWGRGRPFVDRAPTRSSRRRREAAM